jgi:hypothetical protein
MTNGRAGIREACTSSEMSDHQIRRMDALAFGSIRKDGNRDGASPGEAFGGNQAGQRNGDREAFRGMLSGGSL